MAYDFDEEINRFDTHCMKWEFEKDGDLFLHSDHAHPKFGDDQMLPLWVADMDFQSPPPVIEALEARAAHGLFGYCKPMTAITTRCWPGWPAATAVTIEPRLDRDHARRCQRLKTIRVDLHCAGGQSAHPAAGLPPLLSGHRGERPYRRPQSLETPGTRYEMDFDDLARTTADPARQDGHSLQPAQPGRPCVDARRSWPRFGQICRENGVLVISDEIHCDIIFDGQLLHSVRRLSDEFAADSIICTAPSKTLQPGRAASFPISSCAMTICGAVC